MLRLRNGNLYEEKRQERKDGRLYEPDKDLKQKHRDRNHERNKMLNNKEKHPPRKDIPKKTK